MRYFFVSGPPRSGTTFLSDWLTEVDGVYCAHEVLGELSQINDFNQIPVFLQNLAATGADRYNKKFQHEFLDWSYIKVEKFPICLGIKNPWIWDSIQTLPKQLLWLIRDFDASIIVIVRHPYDTMASGVHRKLFTKNWPFSTVYEHCQTWKWCIEQLDMIKNLSNCLIVHWEELICSYLTVKGQIESHLAIKLPDFIGYEVTKDTLSSFASNTSRSLGYTANSKRQLLSQHDLAVIKQELSEAASELNYDLR